MDGVHDLGGRQGFGRIRYRAGAPAFHAAWEKRVNALYGMAVRRGIFNMDEYRHAIERMPPRHYLSASYYERSLTSLATLCVEKGVVTREELEELAKGHFPLSEPSAPGRSNLPGRERFQAGDRVRVKNDFFAGHVRMPGYIRGKPGVVVSEFSGLSLSRCTCAWRQGRGRAHLRRRLPHRGPVAKLGGPGAGTCRRVPELLGAGGLTCSRHKRRSTPLQRRRAGRTGVPICWLVKPPCSP